MVAEIRVLSLYSTFKKSRVLVILQNAAGTFQSQTCKVPDYCYMIRGGTNTCLLGRVTGLFFVFI